MHLQSVGSICLVCASPTTFVSISIGYRKYCSVSCSTVSNRKKLKANDIKFTEFRNKVSVNQKQIWEKRHPIEKQNIAEKTSNKNILKNKNLNAQQRKEKYSRYYKCDAKTIESLNEKNVLQCMTNFKNGKSGYKTNMKGKFKPNNPSKYKGDPTNIIYRSSWEAKFMKYLDEHQDVINWMSEEIIVPYRSPVDGKLHRYFPDFLIKKRNVDGTVETVMVEIKPASQTVEPVKKKTINKAYINEVMTWGVNQAKWKAASEFCADRKWRFLIMTEKELGIKW